MKICRSFCPAVTFDYEGLPDMREVQVAVELSSDPDLAGFNASMIWRGMFDEVRLLSVAEVQLDIGKESRLVSFDREMIVGTTFLDQVAGECSLG